MSCTLCRHDLPSNSECTLTLSRVMRAKDVPLIARVGQAETVEGQREARSNTVLRKWWSESRCSEADLAHYGLYFGRTPPPSVRGFFAASSRSGCGGGW